MKVYRIINGVIKTSSVRNEDLEECKKRGWMPYTKEIESKEKKEDVLASDEIIQEQIDQAENFSSQTKDESTFNHRSKKKHRRG